MYQISMVPRTLIGPGSVSNLPEDARRLGAGQVFLVTSPSPVRTGLVQPIVESLVAAGLGVTVYDGVTPEPTFAEFGQLMASVRAQPVDLVVGLGGGSVIDLAKLAAAMVTNPGQASDYVGIGLLSRPALPMIMVPTTAGTGAETTPNSILTNTDANLKQGVVSPYLMPNVAILDANLTLSLPPKMTAYTGMDALTHALESYVAQRANPLSRLCSAEAARLIIRWLPEAVERGENLEAREAMLYASYLAGVTITNAGTGAVHALAYPLGGEFGVPHGLANSLLMPHVFAVNARGREALFAELSRQVGWADASKSDADATKALLENLTRLGARVGIPASLREIGIPREALEGLARATMGVTRLLSNNPRPLTEAEVLEAFHNAY